MQLPVRSTTSTSCERHLGCIVTRFSCKNSASSSDLPPVANTDVPEPKTPVGAIVGGKFLVTLSTLSAKMFSVRIVFVRDDRWFGRAVHYRICIALLSQTGRSRNT